MTPLSRAQTFRGYFACARALHYAEVTLDGTLGPAGPVLGPNYEIAAPLDQQRGGNLFHSFGRFNVVTGESATFSGPNSVTNIISRVTGGEASWIDGTLRSTVPGADLYLLNPWGLAFGANAALDVLGSFYASTADYLRLGVDGYFVAKEPGTSALSMAPVAAFGFLGDSPGSIAIQGSVLGVPQANSLSLIGGDLRMENATLRAPAGAIEVATTASRGEVLPTDSGVELSRFARLGSIDIVDAGAERTPVNGVVLGNLDVSGEGGGAILIRGGHFDLAGGYVQANTLGNTDGKGINIEVDSLRVTAGGRIAADTLAGAGRGGTIFVSAKEDLVISGQDGTGLFSEIAAVSEAPAMGDAGDIVVATPTLELDAGAVRSSTSGVGDAGVIELRVDELLLSRGQIASATLGGSGRGGQVIIKAAEMVSVSGEELDGNPSGIFALTAGAGDGGSIVLEAKTLAIDGG